MLVVVWEQSMSLHTSEKPPPPNKSGAYSASHHEYPNKHIAKSHNIRVGLVGNIIWAQGWNTSTVHPHPRHHPTHYFKAPISTWARVESLSFASFGSLILGVAKLSWQTSSSWELHQSSSSKFSWVGVRWPCSKVRCLRGMAIKQKENL